MRPRLLAVLLASTLALSGCSGDPAGDRQGSPPSSRSTGSTGSSGSTAPSAPSRTQVTVDRVVARGLVAPWGMTFLPDGSALVSERDSDRIVRVSADGTVQEVGRVGGVDGAGEGGLLGIALSPAYEKDSTLFAYLTAGSQNVVVRMSYDDETGEGLTGQRTVFDGIPAGPVHNGGRIAFGPDGFLYVGTGDSGRTELAPDPDSLGGKILRITAEGDPAPGNPFGSSPVYSLGHRNVQGLAWDQQGRLWASEFGQNTWDELNLIEAGADYGWPEVEGRTKREDDYVDPVRQWSPEEASPSGIAFAGGSVFMAGLRGERLWQIPVRGGRTGRPEPLIAGKYGRLRAVTTAPDGSLWVMTSNRDGRGSPRAGDDKVVRLTLS